MKRPKNLKIGDKFRVVEGDVIVDEDGDEQIVLGVCGKVIFISNINDHEGVYRFSTAKRLRELGYTMQTSRPEVTELTMEEVAEKFGVDVENIRIKE